MKKEEVNIEGKKCCSN